MILQDILFHSEVVLSCYTIYSCSFPFDKQGLESKEERDKNARREKEISVEARRRRGDQCTVTFNYYHDGQDRHAWRLRGDGGVGTRGAGGRGSRVFPLSLRCLKTYDENIGISQNHKSQLIILAKLWFFSLESQYSYLNLRRFICKFL